MATARPMPLSPPVITAALPTSLPDPVYVSSPQSGRGVIRAWVPGTSCCCTGWLMAGSCRGVTGRDSRIATPSAEPYAVPRHSPVPEGRAPTRPRSGGCHCRLPAHVVLGEATLEGPQVVDVEGPAAKCFPESRRGKPAHTVAS